MPPSCRDWARSLGFHRLGCAVNLLSSSLLIVVLTAGGPVNYDELQEQCWGTAREDVRSALIVAVRDKATEENQLLSREEEADVALRICLEALPRYQSEIDKLATREDRERTEKIRDIAELIKDALETVIDQELSNRAAEERVIAERQRVEEEARQIEAKKYFEGRGRRARIPKIR